MCVFCMRGLGWCEGSGGRPSNPHGVEYVCWVNYELHFQATTLRDSAELAFKFSNALHRGAVMVVVMISVVVSVI